MDFSVDGGKIESLGCYYRSPSNVVWIWRRHTRISEFEREEATKPLKISVGNDGRINNGLKFELRQIYMPSTPHG